MREFTIYFLLIALCLFSKCKHSESGEGLLKEDSRVTKIAPTLKTDIVPNDTDDPAIWYNNGDPEKSLILGTDKDIDGALLVFDVNGKLDSARSIWQLAYPNNVDVEYGFVNQQGEKIDIAVTVERQIGKVRIFKLPDMIAIDNGGIDVFEGEENDTLRRPMGVGLYKNPNNSQVSVILSRKSGPTDGTYLWQYLLKVNEAGYVDLALMRKFGDFSGGESEIEAIMVDDAQGYVYYSDEAFGVRKYHADPEKGSEELAVFGKDDFAEDREGIALWPKEDSDGFIIISDQQANSFNVYERNPSGREHKWLGKWMLSTIESDGCDLIAKPFGLNFPNGVFVAMSEDRTFHLYDLRDLPTF